jgi:hypothetical protein
MREVGAMGKRTDPSIKPRRGVSERGGYPAGPRTSDQLTPPPKGPAPGAKPSPGEQPPSAPARPNS